MVWRALLILAGSAIVLLLALSRYGEHGVSAAAQQAQSSKGTLRYIFEQAFPGR